MSDTTAAAAKLESADAYCLRRRNELHAELAMCRQYVAESSPSRCAEAGVGGAYIRRRNSRYGSLHATRLSEMQGRADAAEQALTKLPLLYEYCFPVLGHLTHSCYKSLCLS